jgi:hypothetical protein
VREKIVKLLRQVAFLNHPRQDGGEFYYEIRTQAVIDLLVGPALAKQDRARTQALEWLCEHVTPANLRTYPRAAAILKALKEDQDWDVKLLAAKAKIPGGAVKHIMKSRGAWHEGSGLLEAAYGDTVAEDAFLAEADAREKEQHGPALALALKHLAQIGTKRSITAICQRMRTPIRILFPAGDAPYVRSARLYVMEALRYNFPDHEELDPDSVQQESDYTKVEEFCTKNFGVSYEGIPVPEFLAERDSDREGHY